MKWKQPPYYQWRSPRDITKLYFNIELGTFRYEQQSIKYQKERISITDFYSNYTDAWNFIEEITKKDPDNSMFYVQCLSKLNLLNQIRSYDYYVEEEKLPINMPLPEVVKIFSLVNKQWRKLLEEDLALAYISVQCPWLKADMINFLDDLRSKNFMFDLKFLTACINAVWTNRWRYIDLYKLEGSSIQEAWNLCKRSIIVTISFLRDKLYIGSSDTYELKSTALIIPVIVYFSLNNQQFVNPSDENKMKYRFYNAMIRQRYTRRWKSSPLEQDIVTLSKENNIDSIIQNLLREVRDVTVTAEDLSWAPVSSPFFNMALIIAKSKWASDWFTPSLLHTNHLWTLYSLEKHHIFPTDYLKNNWYNISDQAVNKKVNQIANRAFLTKKANLTVSNRQPSIYLKEINKRDPGLLLNQCVPLDTSLYEVEQFDKFLLERQKLLAGEMNEFLKNLNNKNYNEKVEELVIKEESHTLEFKETFNYDVQNQQKDDKDITKFASIKTIAGFLNAEWWILLIWVSDDWVVLWIDRDKEVTWPKYDSDSILLLLRSQLKKYKFPDEVVVHCIRYNIELVNNIEVLRVDVASWKSMWFKPVFTTHNWIKKLYIRNGNQTDVYDDPEVINDVLSC